MSVFHDVLFPVRLAFGARGGPRRQVDITTLSNGHEVRNSSQSLSRRVFDVGTALKSKADIYEILEFFEARHGALYAFRFKDPMDHRSANIAETVSAQDQTIGEGDGNKREFQLIKTYKDSFGQQIRPITKPVQGSVIIAINGQETTDFTLNPLSGLVTLSAAPQAGAVISAGFEFDTPVRFDSPSLDISLDVFGAGEIPSIALIEVLDHA